jgi:hypothetical protein
MLETISVNAAYCYQRAEEAGRMAQNCTDASLRQDFQGIQAHWIRLARSYDFATSLNTFCIIEAGSSSYEKDIARDASG